MSDREKLKKRYYRRKMLMGKAILTLWILISVAIFTSSSYTLFSTAILISIFCVVLLLLLYASYIIDKKYRKIELCFSEYALSNWFVFIIFIVYGVWILLVKITLNASSININIFLGANLILIILALFLYKNNLMYLYFLKRARPLENKKLVNRIKNLQRKMGIGEVELYILQGKRMKVANAYQVGTKNYVVFLYDYLLENLNCDEILAVIAHEFAHIKLKHTARLQIISFLYLFYILNASLILIHIRAQKLYSEALFILTLLIVLSLFLLPVVLSFILRRFEREADLLAVANLENKEWMITALEKLSDINSIPKNLSRFAAGTHPSIYKRIEYIKNYRG